MENEKPKFQPWNEEEFQSDVFVRGMNAVQRWMYRSLLQASFFHTTRPYLPDDDRILWVLAGCESKAQWLENKSEVLDRFTPVDGKPGMLENKRVTKDWNNLLDFREEMSELGKKRASKAERTESGQFKPRGFIAANGKPATAGASLEESDESTSGVPAREEKVREDKISEDKGSKDSNTRGGGDSLPNQETTQNHGGDWKTFAVSHRRIFGSQASTTFKEKYAEACKQYGESVVLECFEDWANDAKDWVKRDNVKQPFFAFLKKLPDMAEVILAANREEEQLAVQRRQQEQQRQATHETIEANVEKQKQEDAARWQKESPPEIGGDVLEYLAEIEAENKT
jgi:hypothetical protein